MPITLQGKQPQSETVQSKTRKKAKPSHRHNWRIDMLSIPRGHTEQLEYFKLSKAERENYIRKKQQEAHERELAREQQRRVVEDECERRRKMKLDQLSVFSPRYYIQKKEMLKDKDAKLGKALDRNLEIAKKSPYHEYARAKLLLKKNKEKRKKKRLQQKVGKGKGRKYARRTWERKKASKHEIAAAIEYCRKMAVPKKRPQPPKINRGKRGPINVALMSVLSKPKIINEKFWVDPNAWKTQQWVSLKHLKYRPTAKILEMARPKKVFLYDDRELGTVEPSALTAKASKRINELAKPRVKVSTITTDFDEEHFTISPLALKYVATPRIIELAKPHRRR